MFIITCLKDKNIWLLGLLALMLCSCSSVQTSVEPLTYGNNRWVVQSNGNGSDERVFAAAERQAAEKSNSEGMDCFVLEDNKWNYFSRSGVSTTRTMQGKSSDGSSFSYEVPDKSHYSMPRANIYVSFHKHDECKNFEITKGQDKVFYNNEAIKNAKSLENKDHMLEFFVWGVIPASFIALLILI